MRELIRTMSIPKASHHLTRLNTQCRANLAWWSTFLTSWNGVSLFPGLPLGETVTADASGSWGGRAFRTHPLQWFQCEWPTHWRSINIAVKEMVSFVIAAAMWGHSWRGQRIRFRSGNMVVVQTLGRHSPKDPQLAHLLRCLFFSRHISASITKQHMSLGWRIRGRTRFLVTGLTFSSLCTHRQPPSRPARPQPHSPTYSTQASAGHHRAGGRPFELLCRRSRISIHPYICQCQEAVHRVLWCVRSSINSCIATHKLLYSLLIWHIPGSAPRRTKHTWQPSATCT